MVLSVSFSGSHRVSISETKSKKFFSRNFVNCDVTHYNWTVTSYVAVRVLVRVYMHDVTSDVWRHQKKIFKVKVQHSEKSGFVTECHFRKQNPWVSIQSNFRLFRKKITFWLYHPVSFLETKSRPNSKFSKNHPKNRDTFSWKGQLERTRSWKEPSEVGKNRAKL